MPTSGDQLFTEDLLRSCEVFQLSVRGHDRLVLCESTWFAGLVIP